MLSNNRRLYIITFEAGKPFRGVETSLDIGLCDRNSHSSLWRGGSGYATGESQRLLRTLYLGFFKLSRHHFGGINHKMGVNMKTLQLSLLTLAILMGATMAAKAGNCDYPWQTASDGSRCGGRAGSERPGGN